MNNLMTRWNIRDSSLIQLKERILCRSNTMTIKQNYARNVRTSSRPANDRQSEVAKPLHGGRMPAGSTDTPLQASTPNLPITATDFKPLQNIRPSSSAKNLRKSGRKHRKSNKK